MAAGGLGAIDWHAPWLAPLAEAGRRATQRVQAGACVATALNALVDEGAVPAPGVRFVPQAALPAGVAYEQFVFAERAVPTRDHLHDFLNGLAWLAFPQAKRRLNALQAAEIARDGVRATRGPVRDAITLLDESGALLAAPEPLWQALTARQWQRLFVELRPLWQQAQCILFGHALLEQLIQPRKPLTAHVYQARTAMKPGADIDTWLAHDLDAAHLARKPFTPLPVLGIPGWCADNANYSFYDDSFVFRSARVA